MIHPDSGRQRKGEGFRDSMIPREGKSHGYGDSSRSLLKFSLSDFMARLIRTTVVPKTLVVEVESRETESRKSRPKGCKQR